MPDVIRYRAIQNSQESIAALARRYDIAPATVAKWKKRKYVHDTKMEPKIPRSTVLTLEEKAIIVVFCGTHAFTFRWLSICFAGNHPTSYTLISSSPLQRHDISRLPDVDGDKPKKKKFKSYPIGDLSK